MDLATHTHPFAGQSGQVAGQASGEGVAGRGEERQCARTLPPRSLPGTGESRGKPEWVQNQNGLPDRFLKTGKLERVSRPQGRSKEEERKIEAGEGTWKTAEGTGARALSRTFYQHINTSSEQSLAII